MLFFCALVLFLQNEGWTVNCPGEDTLGSGGGTLTRTRLPGAIPSNLIINLN